MGTGMPERGCLDAPDAACVVCLFEPTGPARQRKPDCSGNWATSILIRRGIVVPPGLLGLHQLSGSIDECEDNTAFQCVNVSSMFVDAISFLYRRNFQADKEIRESTFFTSHEESPTFHTVNSVRNDSHSSSGTSSVSRRAETNSSVSLTDSSHSSR